MISRAGLFEAGLQDDSGLVRNLNSGMRAQKTINSCCLPLDDLIL